MIVTRLFPISESNELVVHINSFDWEFQVFGPVKVVFGDESVSCRYIGAGTQSDEAVLKLKLDDSKYRSVTDVAQKYAKFDGQVEIRRSEKE